MNNEGLTVQYIKCFYRVSRTLELCVFLSTILIPCLVTVLDVIIFGEKIYWQLFWIRFHKNFSYIII